MGLLGKIAKYSVLKRIWDAVRSSKRRRGTGRSAL
jgi:hypothetical protein